MLRFLFLIWVWYLDIWYPDLHSCFDVKAWLVPAAPRFLTLPEVKFHVFRCLKRGEKKNPLFACLIPWSKQQNEYPYTLKTTDSFATRIQKMAQPLNSAGLIICRVCKKIQRRLTVYSAHEYKGFSLSFFNTLEYG